MVLRQRTGDRLLSLIINVRFLEVGLLQPFLHGRHPTVDIEDELAVVRELKLFDLSDSASFQLTIKHDIRAVVFFRPSYTPCAREGVVGKGRPVGPYAFAAYNDAVTAYPRQNFHEGVVFIECEVFHPFHLLAIFLIVPVAYNYGVVLLSRFHTAECLLSVSGTRGASG